MTADEDAVRRVLAAAPPEGPMPPEVAARLDETLASLVAHRDEREGGLAADSRPGEDRPHEQDRGSTRAPVADLAKRRRRWPAVLVAAASVTVIGYGAGTVLMGQQSGSDASSAESAVVDREGDDDAPVGGSTAGGGEEAAPQLAGDGPTALLRDGQVVTDRTVTLRSSRLRHDVRTALADAAARDRARPEAGGRTTLRLADGCRLPALPPAARVAPALLDGRPTTLVVRRGTSGVTVATVYSCDDPTQVVAQTRLAGPERPGAAGE